MAGKTITKEDLAAAVKAYCASSGKDSSTGEDGRIRIFQGTPGDNDALLWLEGGNLRTNDPDFALNFAEDWLQAPSKALSPVGNGKMSTPERYGRKSPINGSAIDIVKQCARAIEPTYSVGGNRAPTAKTVLTAAADSGISFEILRYTHRQDYIEACVRAHQGAVYDDAVVSVYKQDFINSRAWDMVGKQAAKGNDLLDLDLPYLENGMPNIKKDAMVNVRIKGGRDEIKTGFQKVNAQIWLYQELMQAWIFQGRQCVTKAKSKAASELLLASNPNTEIQEAGELADEMAEREMVERQKAEAA